MVKITRKLGRNPNHRQMLMRIMVTNLIRVEQMLTTLSKAKEVRRHADRVITIAKIGGAANYRRALSFVNDKTMVRKLFTVIAPRYTDRSGGYTRIIRAGRRSGDNAQMAFIEYLQPGYTSFSKIRKALAPPVWTQSNSPSHSVNTPQNPEIILPKNNPN